MCLLLFVLFFFSLIVLSIFIAILPCFFFLGIFRLRYTRLKELACGYLQHFGKNRFARPTDGNKAEAKHFVNKSRVCVSKHSKT